ncbi:hypothetical protein F4803DRAFT_12167 [Xylaria telfairii]|nr:hypothetical protein F4803DRAFT_12167 [Xylaria telfairii]
MQRFTLPSGDLMANLSSNHLPVMPLESVVLVPVRCLTKGAGTTNEFLSTFLFICTPRFIYSRQVDHQIISNEKNPTLYISFLTTNLDTVLSCTPRNLPLMRHAFTNPSISRLERGNGPLLNLVTTLVHQVGFKVVSVTESCDAYIRRRDPEANYPASFIYIASQRSTIISSLGDTLIPCTAFYDFSFRTLLRKTTVLITNHEF